MDSAHSEEGFMWAQVKKKGAMEGCRKHSRAMSLYGAVTVAGRV